MSAQLIRQQLQQYLISFITDRMQVTAHVFNGRVTVRTMHSVRKNHLGPVA